MGFENFRKAAQTVVQHGKKSGGKKGAWALVCKPPKKPAGSPVNVAQPYVFIPAAYEDKYVKDPQTGAHTINDFHHIRRHNFRKGPTDFRSTICSAGHDPHAPQPCVGCYEADHGAQGAGPRDYYAFNVAHLWNYHMVPWIKEVNGVPQIQYKKDPQGQMTNEPIRVQKECTQQGCEACAAREPMKWGAHRIMEVGSGHLAALSSMNDQAGERCAGCGTYVKLLGYRCANPQCGTQLLDVATCGMNNDALAKYATSKTQCSRCQYTSEPLEIVDCGYDFNRFNKVRMQDNTEAGCVPRGGVTKRLTLSDTVAYLQREGEGTASKIICTHLQPLWEYNATPDGRPIYDHLAEIVKEPFDMEELLAPDDLNEQAKRLNVQNPFGGPPQAQNPSPGYQPYSQPQQPPPGMVPQGGPVPQQPMQPPQGYGQPQGVPQQGPQTYQNLPSPGRPPYGGR